MKRFLASLGGVALVLSLAACSDGGGDGGGSSSGALMDLPTVGYSSTFTGHVTDSWGSDYDIEETALDLYVTRSADGKAAVVSGFLASVGEKSFSLHVDPYYHVDWFGFFEVKIDGAGDSSGMVIDVSGEDLLSEGGYSYEKHYDVIFTGELGTP